MDYPLGQVAIISKGAWGSSTAYAPLNTVTHTGGSFMAIAQNTNKEPGVASDWATYWVAMSRGIQSIAIEAVTASTARAVIVLSDGTTVTGDAFSTTPVGDGTVTTAKLAAGSVTTAILAANAVTAAKLGSDILPVNVGIKMGTTVPTTSDISEGQIYLLYA